MNKKEQKDLKVFGYGLAIIISFIVIRLGMKHGFTNGKFAALAIAAALALLTALRLPAIRPLYRVWMKGARFIGEIMNFVLLSVIFYVFFSITGIVLRLLRKDLLDQKIDKSAKTYWKPARCGPFDRERYTRQF